MTNADTIGMERLEGDLHLALRWEPTATAVDRMDRRVRAMVAAPLGRPLLRTAWRWPPTRLVLILAAGLLLLGAASALTLLQQAASLTPGWQVAYARAERLDLSQTVDGYTVTLERAYGDPNQLVLAFLVDAPSDQPLAVSRAMVTDAEGRSYLMTAASGDVAHLENSSATVSSYQVPPGVGGTADLTVTVADLTPVSLVDLHNPTGPWVFQFRIPFHSATEVAPQQTVEAAGVPITLTSVRITETAVRVRLDMDLSTVRTEQWSRWSFDGTLRPHSGPEQDLMWAPFPPEWTGQPEDEIGDMTDRMSLGSTMVRQTFAGTDSPSGRWTLTISRLWGADGTGNVLSVQGPWVITFDVP